MCCTQIIGSTVILSTKVKFVSQLHCNCKNKEHWVRSETKQLESFANCIYRVFKHTSTRTVHCSVNAVIDCSLLFFIVRVILLFWCIQDIHYKRKERKKRRKKWITPTYHNKQTILHMNLWTGNENNIVIAMVMTNCRTFNI